MFFEVSSPTYHSPTTVAREFDSDSGEFKILVTSAVPVLLLLVAACANLGTLVLARGVARERELRVRMALGAGRLRVVRQLFTESLLLASLGAVCALLLSTAVLKVAQMQQMSTARVLRSGIPAMSGLDVVNPLPYGIAIALFGAVVTFSLLGPGRRAARVNPSQALQDE
jgi:ABC-type antimicrobial peptide transport system permease subunit